MQTMNEAFSGQSLATSKDVNSSVLSPARALIADDQPDVLEALRLLLKGAEVQTEAVTSPAAVLEALRREVFDVLLMDLNYARDTTSGQEGLNLLSEIRGIDSTIPIVVMTAWGTVELAVEAMHRGVQDFVQKPWDNARLLTILRSQIQRGRSLRKAQLLEAERMILNQKIRMVSDRSVLLEIAAIQLQRSLQARSIVFLTSQLRDPVFTVTASKGISKESLRHIRLEMNPPTSEQLSGLLEVDLGQMNFLDPELLKETQADVLVPIKANGEISCLLCVGKKISGDSFDPEEKRFLLGAGEEISIGLHNLRWYEQEREYGEARDILQRLMPKEIPQPPGFEIAGVWQPARIVGGDYFDVLHLDQHRIGLCMADVAGKGMPAALLMSNMQAAVRAFASELAAPKDLCARVNQVICSHMSEDRFITSFYGVLDQRTWRLTYTNAGHSAPLWIHGDGSSQILAGEGAVFGVFREWQYTQSEVELKPGDWLILFTDGVTEAQNAAGEEFGEERLIEAVRGHLHLNADQMQKAILHAVGEFTSGEFQDDATLLVLSATGLR